MLKFTEDKIFTQDQGHGIAGKMLELIKEKYKDFFYLEVMPEESKNALFYEKHGFHVMEDGVPMQIVQKK